MCVVIDVWDDGLYFCLYYWKSSNVFITSVGRSLDVLNVCNATIYIHV